MITKPRNQWKPRSQWKRRAHGRVAAEVQVGNLPNGEPDYALFIFEMTSKGVSARKKHGRKANAKVWTFDQLANGVGSGGQMKLL